MSATSIGLDRNGPLHPNGAGQPNGVPSAAAPAVTTAGSAAPRNGGAVVHGNGAARARTGGQIRTGRLDTLVPHLIRGQLLRPNFVRMSLKLGIARQMPSWAKLQFLNAGVDRADLDRVLGRITSLESWADAWEWLAKQHEHAAREIEARGDHRGAAPRWLAASAAYNFSQYVIFMDMNRKRLLHEACSRTYAEGMPYFDPPVTRFEVPFRRKMMVGHLRVPRGATGPMPVVVMFNGTNSVKEELHWWSEAYLARGLACIMFDGPGMGQTFNRLSMVGDPRAMGAAILNHIETHPELDPGAVAFVGQSLGGHCAIRMAAHDSRIKAVAAVSPPFSVDVYWKVTLAGMRRELAALYGIEEREMEQVIDRITLAGDLPELACPLFVAGGGQDHITPGTEAWRIYQAARSEREIVYYERGGHDCFNVMSDLRPRLVSWLARQLEPHRGVAPQRRAWESGPHDPAWNAADAVDPELADALCGELPHREWHEAEDACVPVRWEWPWARITPGRIEVVHEARPSEHVRTPWIAPI